MSNICDSILSEQAPICDMTAEVHYNGDNHNSKFSFGKVYIIRSQMKILNTVIQ